MQEQSKGNTGFIWGAACIAKQGLIEQNLVVFGNKHERNTKETRNNNKY